MVTIFDLTDPRHAYLFGFVQCDGTLRRGPGRKGRLNVELAACDTEHLQALADLIPARTSLRRRTRDTNFKKGHESCVLDVFDLRAREALRSLGMPEGRKSALIAPPCVEHSRVDYFRGVVDADGSLGFTASGLPFLSLCTRSARLAGGFGDLIAEITGQRKHVRPKARDRAFNVMCWKEDAQEVAAALYVPDAIALPRKAARAREILAWRRPPDLVRRRPRHWTGAEDRIALDLPVPEAMEILRRSRSSVARRARRLRAGKELRDAV